MGGRRGSREETEETEEGGERGDSGGGERGERGEEGRGGRRRARERGDEGRGEDARGKEGTGEERGRRLSLNLAVQSPAPLLPYMWAPHGPVFKSPSVCVAPQLMILAGGLSIMKPKKRVSWRRTPCVGDDVK
eukprot:763850-Hanusia_phi.AAC.1